MSTIRGVKDRKHKFTQLLNIMLDDPLLSLKAKGFIGYCLMKPTVWKFHISHLSKVLKEGERALYSVIDECIEIGYAIRYQTRKENGDFGSWETIISDSKEEIALLKEELAKDPDFKEMFTERRFADAQSADAQLADAQSVPPSNTVAKTNKDSTYMKQQQQSKPVCSLEKDNSVVLPDKSTQAFNWLMKIGCDLLGAMHIINNYTEKELSDASGYVQKQIEKNKKKNEPMTNIVGYLRKTLENRWWEQKSC